MKKILTVLIISIFTFALFAASDEGSTTLTLGASVAGKLYHGFTGSDNQSADAIKGELSGATTGSRTVSALDLESGDAQTIGYYNLYTTGSKQATVKFTVNPLTVDVDGTAGADYWVPYLLGYSAVDGVGSGVTISGSSIGAATVAVTSAPEAPTATTVLTTTGNGLRYQALALTATFAGTANATFGLPESTAYQGTIVAAVTAQ